MIGDEIRVQRIAGTLSRNPDARFHRYELADRLSTLGTHIGLRDITRVWPSVELAVGRQNLWAVRPIGQLGYGVAACTKPLPALLSLTYRERNVLTRMGKDVSGYTLQRMAVCEDQELLDLATRQLKRMKVFIADAEATGLSDFQLQMKALDAYRALPWATFTSGRTYAHDEPVRRAAVS